MTKGWLGACAAALAATIAVLAGSATGADPLGLPAQVVDIAPPTSVESYPTLDYGNVSGATDDRTGTTTWRVVEETGNCCENYLQATSGGRLLDFGGSYVNYSDDGVTWKSVRPITPLVNGEGAIVVGPNGDVLGVEWDPYSGDHLLSFKYEAATATWRYLEMPLHQPFYDREWISVVPGPFTIDGRTVPYVTFVKGGYPTKELWLYSTDGLSYTEVSSKFADDTLNGSESRTLPITASAALDWIQPNQNGSMTPLGARGMLAGPDFPATEWSRFDGSAWHGFAFPGDTEPEGAYQVDSQGRLHNVVPSGNGFTYRISRDGGATWKSVDVQLPQGNSFEEWDFKANAKAGVAAVAIHAQDSVEGVDRDLVVKLDIGKKGPRALRLYQVGLGDLGATAGVGNDVRFDFGTVAIFPDGRVATSFLDSTTDGQPALAIEGTTKLASRTQPSDGTAVGTAQAPINGTVLVPSPGAGQRVAGVTSGFLEFDSLAGADNARLSVKATPTLPADVDLYLQRRLADGTWSSDLAAGTTSDLAGETLEGGPLSAGRYRIEVHDWSGPPGLQVGLALTFYNGAGVPGS
jgi:hypothetical protein